MNLTFTHRYAAIVTGPELVKPGIRWRRLSGDTRPVLGLDADKSTERREAAIDQLAAKLTSELPLNIELDSEIPVLLLPFSPTWRGGILEDHEIDLVFDTARQPHVRKSTFVSTAIDAVGARLLIRIFRDGFVEIIPVAYAHGGTVLRQRATNIVPGAISPSYVFLGIVPVAAHGPTGAIQIDAGRLLGAGELPCDPLELNKLASKLFWKDINPRRGSLFQSIGGVMLQAGGDDTDVERATEIVRMALRAEECGGDCVIYADLPSDSCGIGRISGVSCQSIKVPGARHFKETPGLKAEIIAAAAFALCDRWETHSVLPVHSDPFGIDPTGAIAGRQVRITLDAGEKDSSAHDMLAEFALLAGFWRSARTNPRVHLALSPYPSEAVEELDLLYGDFA